MQGPLDRLVVGKAYYRDILNPLGTPRRQQHAMGLPKPEERDIESRR